MENYFKASDGKWLTVGPVEHYHWGRMCRAIGREDLITDERTANIGARARNRVWMKEHLQEHFATKPRDHWVEAIAEADCPVGPVLDYQEVKTHPQFRDNNYIVEVEHPVWGTTTTVGVPPS